MKILGLALILLEILTATPNAEAKLNTEPKKILYIPHDNRPIVDEQTIEVVEKAGYKIISPPKDFLGSRDDMGNPDRLWEWLERNAKRDIKAAVISSDSLIYGSLVASRNHNYDKSVILSRVELFKDFHNKHKKLPLYVFSSIMRTPRNGEASGYEEPDYYRNYGANIFRYTALKDKQEIEGLTPRETKELAFLNRLIPKQAIDDWMDRRNKNFEVNKKLVKLSKDKVFDVLLLGRDDNAPYSQTHIESRNLAKYGAKIDQRKYQTIAGIDEIGLMLLTRAINDYTNDTPTVFVTYNFGVGAGTVPSFSDETIDDSINDELVAIGAKRINAPRRADLILAVNTNPDGKTYDVNHTMNNGTERSGTKYIVDRVQSYLEAKNPVAIADIAFSNGADNALMGELRKRHLLFKLQAYAGWNTATNSTGFALSNGILAKNMTRKDRRSVLMTRYLDDWAYQANVRKDVVGQLSWISDDSFYNFLNDKRYHAADWSRQYMTNFIKSNLPEVGLIRSLRVDFPWNRMFESEIKLS